MKTHAKQTTLVTILIIATCALVGCGDGGEANGEDGNIEGTWNAVSGTQSEGQFGTATYGKGTYANTSIRFTLNPDGSYKWVTANTSSTSAQTVNCTGTYAYTPSASKLKLQGDCVVGSLSYGDDHLYTVEQLTSSGLSMSEVTGIHGIGTQSYVFSR
jgi:hypothetical protein